MTDSSTKLSHKDWRKAAKKARRKRIRQKLAEIRNIQEKLKESSPRYQLQLQKETLLTEFELEKEIKEREERHKKWLEDEEKAQRIWREEEKLKKLALEEKLKEQKRIREEWEKEQEKIREKKQKLEALKKEEERRQLETLERINNFISNGGEIPYELRSVRETNPGKEMCLFFNKVGACRFGNQCSRNHQHLKISNTLMITNFYSHFTLDQSKSSEYDTDISLEYEDSEMYLHFKEFYNDVVPEFKKFGEITMVKVCCNVEVHLRGNVYVEFKSERDALVAYKAFQGRWYGGKQLNLEFVKINDWGGAVCGDFSRHRCPKGKSCNFLHVFRNPKNEFPIEWKKIKKHNEHKNSVDNCDDEKSSKKNWNWSESPDRYQKINLESSRNKIKSKSRIKKNKKRSRSRSESRNRVNSRSRSRSRQRMKNKSKSRSRSNSRLRMQSRSRSRSSSRQRIKGRSISKRKKDKSIPREKLKRLRNTSIDSGKTEILNGDN